jgi:O-antigen/teichoic acid export membrane protein
VSGTTIFQTIILLAGAGSGITLARSLGPLGRGEFATAILWTGILVFIGDLGLGFSFSYHAGKHGETVNELWTLALLVGLVVGSSLALFGWIVVPEFVPALRGPARSGFGLALYSVPMVLTAGYQAYLLLGTGHVGAYNAIRTVAGISYVLLVLLFAALGWKSVDGFAITYVLAQLCALLVSTALIVKRLRPRVRFHRELIFPVFKYGIQTQMAGLASQVNLRADQAVMSLLLPAEALGQYAVAVTASGILSPLLSALSVVIMPRTMQTASLREGAILAAQYVKAACIVSVPIVALAVIILPWALPIVFGEQFGPASFCAQILMVAGLFSGINMVLNNSLRGLGRAGMPAIAEATGMIGTIALLCLLLPRLGIVGAAVTSLVAYATVTVLQFHFVARTADMGTAELATAPLDSSVVARARQLVQAFARRSI